MLNIKRAVFAFSFIFMLAGQAYAFLGFGTDKTDFNNAKKAYAQGNYEEAIKLFKTVTEKRLSPSIDKESYYLLGQSYEFTNQRDQAMITYRFATALYPADIPLNYRKGKLYYEMELFDQAKESFLSVLKTDSCHADTHTLLADVYMKTGFFNQASDHYFEALKNIPVLDLYLWDKYAKALMRQRRFEEAEDAINFMLKFNKNNPDFWVMLSDISFARGLINQSVSEIAKAEELSPRRKDIIVKHILRLCSLGNIKAAKTKLQPLLKNSPDALVYTAAGFIYNKEGNPKEAAKAFRAAKSYAAPDEHAQFISNTADALINIITEENKSAKEAL